jgi:ABC-type multidrug transport system fused ATPase/permease subunit
MNLLKKLNFLFTASQKRQLIILGLLILIGIFFEMIGLGVMIPALGIILNPNLIQEYPSLFPFIKLLGFPTQLELIVYGMSTLVFIYLSKTLYLMFLAWKQSQVSSNLSSFLAQKLFLGYLELPYSFHLQRNSSDLIRNIQSEVNLFNTVSISFIGLATEISAIIGVATMLFIVEPVGTISIGAFLFVFAFIFHQLTRSRLLRWGKDRQEVEGRMVRHLTEGFGSIKISKVMHKTNYFFENFSRNNNMKAEIFAKATTLQQFPRLYLEFLAVIALSAFILTMIYIGESLANILPIIGVFVVAAFRLMPSINRIMGGLQNIRYAKPVIDVLYNEFNNIENNKRVIPKNKINELEFNNIISINGVNFSYKEDLSGHLALKNISLHIFKGESVGFIGPSGSGKSTLVDLLIGVLKPQIGFIYVDNIDIYNNMSSWQNHIGYVPQFIYLTDDSIINNIAFGICPEKIDKNAVLDCLIRAQLVDFVNSLPLGLDTMVGEQGVQLSGGQRQRIGIARALYNNPDILILDEATSSLDLQTEIGVMEAITAMKGEKTIIIIAHRLSTIEHCDRIYRMNSGMIVEEIIN